MDNYVTLKIPRGIADQIDRIIEQGNLGYRSRAEFVNEGIRILLSTINGNNNQQPKNNNNQSNKQQTDREKNKLCEEK